MSEALSPLPPEFCARLEQIVPAASLPAVMRSFEVERATTLRVNTLRTNVDDAMCELQQAGIAVERCAWCDVAGIVPAAQKRQLTEHSAVMDGRVYIQGLSSLLAAFVLAPKPGEAALDLAAAPGGKTLHMAATMQKHGRLSAVEPVRGRFFKLRDNLRRGGADDFVRLYQTDGRLVGRKTPEQFDSVLLDAPCTSEARFDCRNPKTWQYWGPRKLAESARKQKALLRSAIDATRIGGRILYCTCSFAPEENEMIVAHTLRRLTGKVEVLPFELPISNVQQGLTAWNGKPLPAALALARRVLPNEIMDGFFLTLLQKTAATREIR